MEPKHVHPHHTRKTVRTVLFGAIALGGAACFFAGGIFLLWATTLTIPTVDAIEAQRREQSTKIFDRTGEVLLYDMHQDVQRTAVPLDQISDHVKHATIAIEDAGFYSHFGVEPLAIVRAVLRNLQQGNLLSGQGGSTITQQVIKNTLLSQEKTITRKLKEWILAIKLEQALTKEEILEMYLNEAPYGGTKYGVEEASQGFFGKAAHDLTIAESAYLAALPQAPTYYSPYGNNRSALDERKNKVLAAMHSEGYITKEEYDAAKAEDISFRPQTGASIKAPHFVFYVIEELAARYGDADLAQANLHVVTTLDWDLQKEAERIVYEQALTNATTFNASNASLMAIDPRTGGIMVMVGSRDYFDESIDGNFNIGLAKRQPGSSFKPFAYAAAIDKGYTSETIVYDVPTQFSTACDLGDFTSEEGCYSPNNYDNAFRGPITFRNALAQSVNVPAVKALYLAGTKSTIQLAHRMGVTSLDASRDYGLTLVLGGGEVSLLEMTSAYGVFAQEGERFPHTGIFEVRDAQGALLETLEPHGERVLDQDVARTITDMLTDNSARTPAFGAQSYLYFPERAVAAKTGTTNDYRDAWIIGYTPSIAVGAWAGNNDNTPMEKKVAGFIVAPMWNAFLRAYFDKNPDVEEFIAPAPLDASLHPILRGIPLGVTLSQESLTEEDSSRETPHSILHYIAKNDPRGAGNSTSDGQYPYWEYGVAQWYAAQNTSSSTNSSEDGAPKPTVTIISPTDGVELAMRDDVDIEVEIVDENRIVKVDYYIDGETVATLDADEVFTLDPQKLGLTSGTHTLFVVAKNSLGGRGGVSINVVVQ
ncbi:MAG: penicillin-binding protein [Candidatus Pacebacteria bacterium]|nr:penicillin-binding protein [Candidatus Paceibacterota bacterium]